MAHFLIRHPVDSDLELSRLGSGHQPDELLWIGRCVPCPKIDFAGCDGFSGHGAQLPAENAQQPHGDSFGEQEVTWVEVR